MEKNKMKLFIENFFVYGLGGIISKVIPLIMVPFITRLMPNSSYYGISDLSNTVIQFGSALAVMGMYDAMYRLFFEKGDEDYKRYICSTAFIITLITSTIVSFVMVVSRNVISKYVFGSNQFDYLVYITAIATLVGATNSIMSAPTRMQNKRKIFLIMNTVSPVFSYGIAIPLLLSGHYIIALPIAAVIAGASSECVFWALNREWFALKYFHKEYIKPLLSIAIPLLPNFLIYWIFNSCDKLMLVNLIGTNASGIYSVGSKLGHASQLIYIAFAGGWQFFAFSTMKERNQVKNNSLVFEYLGVVSFVCSVFIFTFSQTIYNLLFEGEFVSGYIVAPYLFLSPLLQMLFQVASNQFLVVKKTWPNLFILSSGAVVNVALNLLLIPKMGIEGAAIATLIGYIIADFVCIIVLCKMKLHILRKKFVFASVIMLAYIVIWRTFAIQNLFFSIVLMLTCSIIFIWLYKGDIQILFTQKKK